MTEHPVYNVLYILCIILSYVISYHIISDHKSQYRFNIPMLLFNALSVHTRLRSTMVSPREAQRAMCAGGAQAVEPIDLVHTGPSTHTWV